jgi:hypothetical protein
MTLTRLLAAGPSSGRGVQSDFGLANRVELGKDTVVVDPCVLGCSVCLKAS